MLCLNRNVGQRIKIGDEIWITVVQARGNKIKIGIDAPAGVKILREELVEPQNPPAKCEVEA